MIGKEVYLLLLILKAFVDTLEYSGGQEEELIPNSLCILYALYIFQLDTKKCDFKVFWGVA